jgi:ABC-type molybdate transport system ATPase subunit
MKNVEMKLDGDILTIKVDVTKEFGPSSSGKTIIIATTEGNISIPEKDDVKLRLHVYRNKTAAV